MNSIFNAIVKYSAFQLLIVVRTIQNSLSILNVCTTNWPIYWLTAELPWSVNVCVCQSSYAVWIFLVIALWVRHRTYCRIGVLDKENDNNISTFAHCANRIKFLLQIIKVTMLVLLQCDLISFIFRWTCCFYSAIDTSRVVGHFSLSPRVFSADEYFVSLQFIDNKTHEIRQNSN